MQTRSNHLDHGPRTRAQQAVRGHNKKLAPPGVWDRDPLEDATGASLLIELPDALANDELLVRAWVAGQSRIGAPLVAELRLTGLDPWDHEIRAWLGHVGSWTLARTSGGAIMHSWIEERDIRYPSRLVSRLEELVALVRAHLLAYEGFSEASSAPEDHIGWQRRLEQLWGSYRVQGRPSRLPAELMELAVRVARHEARRLRPNLPEHCDQMDIEARAVLSVFDSIDQAWRVGADVLVPRIRRAVRWIVLDELHGEAQLTQEERALLGIDSLKVSLEEIESDEEELVNDSVLRPSEPPESNPRWVPCDHLSNAGK